MYEMPFQRAVERMARPRAVFSKMNAGHGLGAASRLSGNNGKVHKFATGGIMDSDPNNYFDPTAPIEPALNMEGILGGSHSGPSLYSSIPSYDLQEARNAPRSSESTTRQNADGSITFVPASDNPGSSSGPHGFTGWMQSKHAGLTGADWMKAGLTALTGILSGVAAKRTSQGRFARGGIVCMADGGQAPEQPAAPQAQPEDVQSQVLVANAIKALLGQSQNPDADIQAFVAHFGKEALQELMQKVQGAAQGQGQDQGQQQAPEQAMARGGILHGPGDGMSDSIPANGGQLRVGNGEYVLDADTVSSIGNGSTEAGARKLDAARMALRKMKTGRASQPPAVHDRHNPLLKALR